MGIDVDSCGFRVDGTNGGGDSDVKAFQSLQTWEVIHEYDVWKSLGYRIFSNKMITLQKVINGLPNEFDI